MDNDRMSKVRWVQDNVMETKRYFTDNIEKISWVMDYCTKNGSSSSKGAVAYLEDVWENLTELGYGDVTKEPVSDEAVSGTDEDHYVDLNGLSIPRKVLQRVIDDAQDKTRKELTSACKAFVDGIENRTNGIIKVKRPDFVDDGKHLDMSVKFWEAIISTGQNCRKTYKALASAERRDEHLAKTGGV